MLPFHLPETILDLPDSASPGPTLDRCWWVKPTGMAKSLPSGQGLHIHTAVGFMKKFRR
jgi:hypothetical protein